MAVIATPPPAPSDTPEGTSVRETVASLVYAGVRAVRFHALLHVREKGAGLVAVEDAVVE